MLRLGSITLDVPFFQAPLSGYADRAMRVLSRQYGAPMTFSGLILDKVACHQPLFENPSFRVRDDEHPIGAQLLGTDPQTMARAAQTLCQVGYDLIDLNFACPAPKVLRRGRGGHLLNEPDVAIAIHQSVRHAVSCPVLIKLRIGFGDSQQSRDRFWQICEQVVADGVDALTVHGRTVVQKFGGQSDWDMVAEVKRRFSQTTVIGSGDLFTAELAVERLAASGADGVVIARGAIGNPWIFRRARALLNGAGDPAAPSIGEQGEVILTHFELIAQTHGHSKAVRLFRKYAAGYCKHHPERKRVQKALTTAGNEHELRAVVNEWYAMS